MKQSQTLLEQIISKLPTEYQKLKTMPEDPQGSVCYGLRYEVSDACLILFPISEERKMPFNSEKIIEGIHQSLAENQGIIQVEAIQTEDNRELVYSIVKTISKSPQRAEYFLRMHVKHEDEIVEIQGNFIEQGITGQREALILAAAQEKGWVKVTENGMEGWCRDPYDAKYTHGILMNLAEISDYDQFFPAHPLTLARGIVDSLKK